MTLETRAQFGGSRLAGRIAGGDRDIDRRKGGLVQAERFSGKAFDTVASDRGTEGARGNRETETRVGFMIGQHR
jgi:hypothetical protein